MQSPVDQIKERLSIQDVVGSYLKLEKAGVNFKARCPFHNEKTPSFFISPSRGTYHCFGCNKGGDIFSFVEEIEGVSFSDSLKTLADKAGVTLRNVDPRLKQENDNLFRLLEEATAYYEEELGKNNEVLLYLTNRGLTNETIKDFRLGFAGSSWSGVYNHLKKKGFNDNDIEKCGLILKNERGPYDRFRDRIMFPLGNVSGKIVGFSGRIFLPRDSAKEKELAKYVNSPDTVLYNKSRLLYGYDKAKQSMLRENKAVLVEGQMDLLLTHQAGITNAIALSGTALTDDHLKMIKRFAETLILALDADPAGVNASERAFRDASTIGLEVKVASFPEGLDPAEFAVKDKEGFKKAIDGARHIVDFMLDTALASPEAKDDRAKKLLVGKRVLPYIARLSNRIDQAHFVGKISTSIGIGESHLWEEIEKLARQKGNNEVVATSIPVSEGTKEARPEMISRKIAGFLSWQGKMKEAMLDVAEGKKRHSELITEYKLPEVAVIPDKLLLESELEAEVYYTGNEKLQSVLNELLQNLERECLERAFEGSMKELQKVEGEGDSKRAEEILKECQEISKKLNHIKNKKI